MAPKKQVIRPVLGPSKNVISEKVAASESSSNLTVNFSKFKVAPVRISGKFNNFFKDSEHFISITANFLGTVLPKITSHTYKEICEGSPECKVLHFHTIDESHRKVVKEILEAYSFPEHMINQMFEGNDIVEFSASLGHVYAARIVCHKVNNVLHLLFFDTNHHIYMKEKYVRESLFYEDCPTYLSGDCHYMPNDCFAAGYLNEELIKEGFEYSFSPKL